METQADEVADGIFRLSTLIDLPPRGFRINQYLLLAEQPLLFHCGPRGFFPAVSAALSRAMPVERLRWIGFGHVESDECGAVNSWLAAAPRAEVIHGATACMVSLNDLCDRPPRPLADGETLDLGGKRVRYLDTPHLPHGWEAGLLYEEETRTLLCGDLFTQLGDGPALVTSDIVGPAIEAEELFRATSLGPTTAPQIRRLRDLAPKTLALMHGPAFSGDCAGMLESLAAYYESKLARSMAGS
ncbi:MAG: hypothetical protein ACREDZ_13380 [Kiloniellales bacterium]